MAAQQWNGHSIQLITSLLRQSYFRGPTAVAICMPYSTTAPGLARFLMPRPMHEFRDKVQSLVVALISSCHRRVTPHKIISRTSTRILPSFSTTPEADHVGMIGFSCRAALPLYTAKSGKSRRPAPVSPAAALLVIPRRLVVVVLLLMMMLLLAAGAAGGGGAAAAQSSGTKVTRRRR